MLTIIIDYGMGNITSVAMALDFLGVPYIVSSDSRKIHQGDGYILPGVGAFPAAMENLRSLDLLAPLTEEVVAKGKPFLGICLGLQLLAKDSTEKGFSGGFGWLDAHVTQIDAAKGLRVPHVGWNNVTPSESTVLFRGLTGELNFYFDHSYKMDCLEDVVAGECEYGGAITAAIEKNNIMATQFHPEKSQRNGLKLLRNFLNYVESSTERQ